ncbi:MAG: penicillin-binding transpeptidase domain-containing protein [Terrimicrobiaceae bacterium]
MISALLFMASALAIPTDSIQKAFAGHSGAFVLIECSSNETFRSDAAACAERLAPCSTFKIWNSAIGLESGAIADPDALFWKWDGTKRWLETWNADQTLRSAFAASCVPAYQDLARRIGRERMQEWLDKIGYGDRNISSGLDVFWLPQPPDRKTLLVTPDEQALMIARLVGGKLPFSVKTLAAVKSIMQLQTTEHGTLFGKTGTGGDEKGNYNMGWFVGYVESAGKTHAFACLLKGHGVMGKDARAATEDILKRQGLL